MLKAFSPPYLFGPLRRRAIFDSSRPRGRIGLQVARRRVLHSALDPAAAGDHPYQSAYASCNRRSLDTREVDADGSFNGRLWPIGLILGPAILDCYVLAF